TPGRRFVVHRLVRALFVVLADESAKALLLRGAVGCGRARRFGFQHAMKLLMRAVLFRCPGAIRSGRMPKRIHQTASAERPPRPGLANGPPLSLRMRSGKPYSANARANRRCVSST